MTATQFTEGNFMVTTQFLERNFMVTGNHTRQQQQDNPQAGGSK